MKGYLDAIEVSDALVGSRLVFLTDMRSLQACFDTIRDEQKLSEETEGKLAAIEAFAKSFA